MAFIDKETLATPASTKKKLGIRMQGVYKSADQIMHPVGIILKTASYSSTQALFQVLAQLPWRNSLEKR